MIISLTTEDRAWDNLGNNLNCRAVKHLMARVVDNPQLGEIIQLPPESSLSRTGGTLIICDRSLWEEVDIEQFFDDIIEEVSQITPKS